MEKSCSCFFSKDGYGYREGLWKQWLCYACCVFFLLVWLWCLSFFELVANAKNEIALLNGQLVMKKEWTKELVDGNMNWIEMNQQGRVNLNV